MSEPVHFVYVGNFDAPHSTENEIRKAIEDAGHTVTPIQENLLKGAAFPQAALAAGTSQDVGRQVVLLWTRTGWSWGERGIDTGKAHALQSSMLDFCRDIGVPSVGYHLDRWWGLSREHLLREEPFFTVDLLCTADGGHQPQFEAAGINHVWFPPAVSVFETRGGDYDPKYHSDVCFVGSWMPGYHQEWTHRRELVKHLQRKWNATFWPPANANAVRGDALKNLYRSSRVVIGDSCLVPKPDGSPMTHYCSDRVPETLGRGGFLIHPEVEGITYGQDSMYQYGRDLASWPLGDWDMLDDLIDYFVHDDRRRIEVAESGRATTKAHHTYTKRVEQLVDLLNERGML